MSLRYLAGFITASYNPLKVPNAPTLGTVTPGSSQVTVAFTAPSNVGGGAITSYIAIVQDTSTGAAFTGTGSSSPITVTGLTNGQTYNVKVAAVNTYGPGPYSAPSGSFSYAPKLYSWGGNNVGQLGQGSTINKSSPTQVGSDTTWDNISKSPVSDETIAVKIDGTIWTWGLNNYGQLGQNDTSNRLTPTQMGALTTWLIGSSGYAHSVAIKTDGTLWSWGRNDYGQLGQNISYSINRSSPVQVGLLTNWSAVVCGYNFTQAIKTDGTLWSWGNQQFGALGLGATTNKSSPTQVGALSNWSKIAAGYGHVLATKTDGTLWSWGWDNNGQLCQGTAYINVSSPAQVGALTTWSNVANGANHSIALKTDGTIWACGYNTFGQIGDITTIARSSLVQVGSLTTWSKIAAGYNHSIAIKTDGTLWAWGWDNRGQQGQNTVYVSKSSPTQIGGNTTWLSIAGGRFTFFATSN